MYWSSNIKKDEVERFGGRCRQAARKAESDGNKELSWFLLGAHAAMESLLFMEYGNDEEAFLSHVTYKFEGEKKFGTFGDAEAGDER